MILFNLLNKSQQELANILGDKISAKSSAVWIAEGVEGLGLLPIADFVVVFLEGTPMMIAERHLVSKDHARDKKALSTLKEQDNASESDMGVTFTIEKEFYELAAFKKGWYDWLNS